MPSKTSTSEKILNRLKGLRKNLQADEQPLFSVPAIWDGGQGQHSTPCDIVVTNQRVFGYYYVSFPRERLFLDALPLSSIRAISLRQKSFEPIFRELLVRGNQRRIYIRAPRQKIESLNEALRSAIGQYAGGINLAPTDARLLREDEEERQVDAINRAPTDLQPVGEYEEDGQAGAINRAPTSHDAAGQADAIYRVPTTVYGKQEIRGAFERSPLAITLLFVGGLLLEIIGALLWFSTRDSQVGLPLCIAGFVSVVTALLVLRSRG